MEKVNNYASDLREEKQVSCLPAYNCDRGLENAARGRKPRVAFSSPSISHGHPRRQITYMP